MKFVLYIRYPCRLILKEFPKEQTEVPVSPWGLIAPIIRNSVYIGR